MYSGADNYYFDGPAEHMPPHGWHEHSCAQVGYPNSRTDPIRALACDAVKELIWFATASGMIHAHRSPNMARIFSTYIGEPSSDPSNHGDVRDVVRGGVLSASVRADTIRNAKALALNPISDDHVCITGESRMLAVGPSCRGPTAAANSETSYFARRYWCHRCGRISLCDPSSMHEVNAIAAFAGATTSIATSGYYLAATGRRIRGGVSYLEQTVKLYDIRAVQSPLPSVLFSAPPMFITCDRATSQLYNTDSAFWMLFPHGVMQLLDISTVTNREPAYPLCDEIHLDAGSDVFTAMAVSSQGLLVLVNSDGFVHQWSSSDSVRVRSSSEPVWNRPVNPEPPTPSIHMDDFIGLDIGATIPKCATSEFQCDYLK
ncbi:WD40/YVTN repeat-like containing protein [Gracilaria domingensis]|nr:WD40/YVTN repeat-like containing protein [Gracilaria domingensis]